MLFYWVFRVESFRVSNFTTRNVQFVVINSAQMSVAIIALFLAVPGALCAWLWWSSRKIGGKRTSQRQPQPKRKPSPYTMQAGDVALAFRVGNRYYDETKNRIFECIALKGKKARLVAFGCLDSVEKELAFLKGHPEFGGFYKVRTDGGVETCQRGALRADRQATEKEIADELEFLRQLRKREAEYKPSGAVQVSVTIGDKTYTSG